MPKDYYKKSTEYPKGTVNTNIPTSDHGPSSIKSVKDALSQGGTNFVTKSNAKEPSVGQGHTGCFGKEAS